MKLDSSLILDIRIDGKTATDLGLLIQTAITRTHVLYYVPTLDVIFHDLRGSFDGRQLKDGTEIEILLASESSQDTGAASQWEKYLVFKCTPSFNQEYNMYTVSGYIAAGHKYLFERATQSYAGTAQAVMEQVVGECGLQGWSPLTTDEQSWWRNHLTTAEFLYQKVLPHTYVDDKSCMMMGYVDGTIYFMNISEAIQGSPDWYIANHSHEKMDFYAAEVRVSNESGLMNKTAGYGMKTAEDDVVNGTLKTHSAVDVNKSDRELNIAEDKRGQTSGANVATLNIGNSAEEYDRAKHQNIRIMSTYTSFAEVLVRETTKIPLFAVVELSLQTGGKPDPSASGKYIVIGKARAGTGKEYVEKICMVRNAINIEDTDRAKYTPDSGSDANW